MSVVTTDGKSVVGVLKGYDGSTNVILEECVERIYSVDEGVAFVNLGLYLIKGDNVAVVGEVDEAKDAEVMAGSDDLHGEPLGPIVH